MPLRGEGYGEVNQGETVIIRKQFGKLGDNWVEVQFNFKLKKDRLARDSKDTTVIARFDSSTKSGKWFKTKYKYFTCTPKEVERIKLYGEKSNAELFIESL